MIQRGRQSACLARRGYTLVELLLVMVLFVFLISIAAVATTGNDRRRLDYGADQFEAMLRMARAEAAIRGRRIRLVPSDVTDVEDPAFGSYSFEWEPDPIGEPGVFKAFDGNWRTMYPIDLVRIERSELVGSSAFRLLVSEKAQAESQADDALPLDPVMFYPDGRSDQCRFVLRAHGVADERRIVLEIDGVNPDIQRWLFTQDELDDYLALIEDGTKPAAAAAEVLEPDDAS